MSTSELQGAPAKGAVFPGLENDLVKFMGRQNLRNRLMNGEAGSVEVNAAASRNQLKEVKEALRGYDPKDIYFMDEADLCTN
ncbi:hypothetical protein PS6_005294 [Mucor atramentarius]